jgi:hypothetical protein
MTGYATGEVLGNGVTESRIAIVDGLDVFFTRAALQRAPPREYAIELVENDGVAGRTRGTYDF